MRAHWRLSAWYFAYFAFIGAYLPYFGLLLESLALTPSEIGIVMSLGQVMRMLVPTLWGWISDRSGRRTPLVRLSALFSLLCFLAYFHTEGFPGLLLATLLLHLFWSGALPLVEALTFAHLGGNPSDYGRIRLWGSIGFIVAVLGVGTMLDHFPIRSLLWISWFVLLGVVVTAWILREAPPSISCTQPDRETGQWQPQVVALLMAGFFMAAAHGPLYVFYSIHLVGHGYGKTLAGVLWSLGVVAEIAIFIAMPRLARQFSLRAILLASFALAVVRFVLIGWWVDALILLVLAQLMHAATFGAHHAATVAALHQWFPTGRQGRVQAIYGSLSFGAGGMFGAILAGQVWESHGAMVSYGLASLLAAIGLLVVMAGIPAVSPASASSKGQQRAVR